MALGDAYRTGKIPYNPMKNVKKPIRKKKNIITLSIEEKKKLFQAFLNSPWCLEFLLAFICGLKKGEILSLKFTDIDMENKTLRIPKKQVGADKQQVFTGEMSTDKYHYIKLPQVVLNQFKIRRTRAEYEKTTCKNEYQDNEYVSSQTCGKSRGYTSMNTELTRLCDRIGLPHLTVSDLRDLYATMMLQDLKVSFVELKELMRYSAIGDVYERYCDLTDDNTDLAGTIDKIFG